VGVGRSGGWPLFFDERKSSDATIAGEENSSGILGSTI
jgi:hypothetical protein